MTNFDLGEPAPDADEDTKPDEESATEGEQSDSSTELSTDDELPSEPESEPEPEPTTDVSSDERNESDADDEPDPTETGPAFPYSEVEQSPLYAHEETWREFRIALDTELTPQLRNEEILDDELREIHDIVLEVAMDNLDEFPERLKEKRRES